ncbi:hypothetical protein GE061_015917 [Apolygus lucorum]|uniref:SDE2-like domain-containing protein n=1 Tax=Apolygus lucorum TaxID=248454 RepID=A0A6A4K0A3_APOLU|nr:hypothetical protein GE061_015917 [Apolygus lucorum]
MFKFEGIPFHIGAYDCLFKTKLDIQTYPNMVLLQLNLICDSLNTLCLNSFDVEDIHKAITDRCKISKESYYLKSDGRIVSKPSDVGNSVQAVPRLRGGKGGFGSMLRAIGAQIEKTTNREACRDLSGRRLRDINEEQRLKKWISQQGERDKEVEEKKKKKLEKLSREPKHEFKDATYESERSDLTDKISDSLEQGIKASASTVKRKTEDVAPAKAVKPKKKKTLLDDDFSSSDDESDDSPSSEPSTSKAICA